VATISSITKRNTKIDSMEVIETKLAGCLILQPTIFADERGYFLETFNAKTFFEKTNIDIRFVQDNESKSNYGVVRGLHFQTGEYAQAKLVSVAKGKVLDIAVDIRMDSPTFLQHIAVELSGENKTQLFIPRGFAHGFAVLEDDTIFTYKCDNFYNKASEDGIAWNCALLNINWQIDIEKCIISSKDFALMNSKQYFETVHDFIIAG
jgi:dTDP-4-dehydrorhamnose 3,5-epimerase